MTNEQLSKILEEHDPAAGKNLPPDSAAAMKRAVLAAVPDNKPRATWWPGVAAVATMLVFVIAALLVTGPDDPARSATSVTQTASLEPASPARQSTDEETSVQQIQYTTEGGTRVIWTLDPDFEL